MQTRTSYACTTYTLKHTCTRTRVDINVIYKYNLYFRKFIRETHFSRLSTDLVHPSRNAQNTIAQLLASGSRNDRIMYRKRRRLELSWCFFSSAARRVNQREREREKETKKIHHQSADARVSTCLENRAPVPPNRPRSIIIIIIITMVIIAMVMMMMIIIIIIIIITIIDTIIYIIYINVSRMNN